jgi:hypothetical protein
MVKKNAPYHTPKEIPATLSENYYSGTLEENFSTDANMQAQSSKLH